MKGKYRIIAIVIALTMAFCAMPINVLADDTEQQTQVEETTVEETTAEEIAETTPINEVPETFPPQTQENTTTPIEESSVVPSEDNEHITDTTTEETFVIVLETIEEETVGSGAVENSSANKTFIPIDMVIGQATVNNTVFTDAYGRAIIDFVEGIYAFENLGNTGFWMDTENSSTSSGAYIQQSAFGATSPVDSFSRNALFKISKQSSTGRYIIRLMTNNKLSFGIEGNKIVTKEIPTVDSEVVIGDTFDIQYSLGGYIIRPYGSQYAICAPNNTSSGTSGSTDSYLYFANPNAVGDRAKWKISMYTGSHRHGTTIYSPWPWAEIGIAVGTTGTLTMKTWSTAIGANTPYVYVQEGSEDMISTSWDFNKSKLTLTAIRPGRATVSAKILYTRSGAAAFTGQARYQILLQKGTHFIKNVATNKCVDIEGPSRAEGAIIQQWTHHSGDQEKWIVEYDNVVGYIRFKSAYSGLYIGVDSSNTSLVKQYSTKNDYTLWRTERTESGNIRLVCKAVTNGYVLAAPSATSGNGADLTMTLYTNDTDYRDEWKIFENVTFGDIKLNEGDALYANIQTDCPNNINSPSDYIYVVTSGANYLMVNNTTGLLTAISAADSLAPSTSTITATHKESGADYTFTVEIFKGNIVMSIFAYNTAEAQEDGALFGHVFLTFYNNSATLQTIGHVTVMPEQEVSVGAWSFTDVNMHQGIWYNKEAVLSQSSTYTDGRVSLTEAIPLDSTVRITYYLEGHNYYSLISHNCCHVAVSVWNMFATSKILPVLYTPDSIISLIKQNNNYETNRTISPVTYIGYFNEDTQQFTYTWGTN